MNTFSRAVNFRRPRLRTAFLLGMCSVLDIGGNMLEISNARFLERTDSECLKGDWVTVGNDIKKAMNDHGQGKPSTVKK